MVVSAILSRRLGQHSSSSLTSVQREDSAAVGSSKSREHNKLKYNKLQSFRSILASSVTCGKSILHIGIGAALMLLAFPPVNEEKLLHLRHQSFLDREEEAIENAFEDTAMNDAGWNSIHVYYGSDNLRGNPKSQCGQDKIVSRLLKGQRNGYFLDLAANDATYLSNTYLLEKDLGWRGLCVEPNPTYWPRLAQRKGCTVVAAVVGDAIGEEVQFVMHENARAASGGIVDGDRFDNKQERPKTSAKPMKLFTTTLADILARFDVPTTIDYFSLDVEGAEYFIMKNFPFDRYTVKLFTIERPKQELIDLLYNHGYEYLAANNEYGMETLWAHESIMTKMNITVIEEEKWLFNITTKYLQIDGSKKPTVIWKE